MSVRLRRRATTALRLLLVAVPGTALASLVSLFIVVRSPLGTFRQAPLLQPIQFDHRHHVGDDAIDCRYCHTTVEKSSTAGYPSTATCMRCHEQIWNRSGILAPLRAAHAEDRPIPWTRVHELPWFVYFDHSIHVNKGIGCVECHGRVDRMAAVMQVAPLTMSWCLECHQNPVPHLRPPDEVTSMTWEAPPGAQGDALRARLARELDVHPRTDCVTCHR